MTIFLQSPLRACAAWMASQGVNATIAVEKRHEDSSAVPDGIYERYQKTGEISVIHVTKHAAVQQYVSDGFLARSKFVPSKNLTGYFSVDNQIVVSKKGENKTSSTPRMGSVDNSNSLAVALKVEFIGGSDFMGNIQEMDPVIQKVREAFFIWAQSYIFNLVGFSIFLGVIALSADSFLQGKGGYFAALQKVMRIGVSTFMFLDCRRVFQYWNMRAKWDTTVINLGGWAAQMRYLAYGCPDLIKKHSNVKYFLIPREIAYLETVKPFLKSYF